MIDMTSEETRAEGPRFLEGTGALVLDRIHDVAYACVSERCDEDLVGELRPAEFRAMCEDMGWGADDIEQSVALLRLNDDGRITLPHFVSWYTDAGVVRNVFAEFDADADQKL